MKIPKLTCIAALLAGCAWPQTEPKPAVDWAGIEQQIEALRVAVLARDLNTTKKQAQELWYRTSQESARQAPTAAERLAKAESIRPPGNTVILPYLAMVAAQAGEWDKARRYAEQTLQNPSDAYDSVHSGNVVLGLVALHDGDVPGAVAYLAAAGKAKGSMILDRWGPNLALAKALLEKGQNAAVLEYFQASKRFVTKNPKLDDWIALLKGGRAPDLSHEYLWH